MPHKDPLTFIIIWMMSRTRGEVIRRLANTLTGAQVEARAVRYRRRGIDLPAHPAGEGHSPALTLTPHPEGGYRIAEDGRLAADMYLTGLGQVAVPVHHGGELPSGVRPGPWRCPRCGCRQAEGWLILQVSETFRFYCNECVLVRG
jgi:hypothetical protein